MGRLLTGVQSSGEIHLGNILGAMKPAIELTKKFDESFLFIADLHSLTTLKDGKKRLESIHKIATAWYACGLDTEKTVFYKQSSIREISELNWYLNCFTPYPMLANSHSFKNKADNLSDVSAGLFTYPVLMAADILLFDATTVPVGKDQKMHLEIARDIAGAFNNTYKTNTFTKPKGIDIENAITITGTDGRKMSKSYGNTINIFGTEKELRKQVNSIHTFPIALGEQKDYGNCNIVQLFNSFASESEIEELKTMYRNNQIGYGAVKGFVADTILSTFKAEREKYDEYIEYVDSTEFFLKEGAKQAREIADKKLTEVKQILGF